jgi:hypothetical protein
MGFAGASATSAAARAAVPVNAVNEPVAWPGAERYPGAVSPDEYGPGSFTPPGGGAGPTATAPGPQPFGAELPPEPMGGGYDDTVWASGHNGPQVPWDSSAGRPFAPSGALDPELHSQDTGGVWKREHVIPAGIGKLSRRAPAAQTYDRLSATQQSIGLTAPNNRQDLDQYQDWDPDGYAPWSIPYSERPIFNNVAYQPVATTDPGTAYGAAGALPDMSPYDYQAVAYQAPPDPSVQPAPAAAAGGMIGGGWVL